MEGFDYLASVSIAVSFISIFLVIFQLHNFTEQRKLESLIQLYDINRQLLTLGFAKPELFEILQDSKDADPLWERHYLQLWLNQISLFYFIQKRGLFQTDLRESWEIDIRDFFGQQNMQRHWRHYRQFYPSSFQHYVDSICPPTEGGRQAAP